MAANFPTQARVVVIGGGIMGCSTAYHLAKLGWKDVVLLEQGRLSGGTTWHAAGLVGQLRSYQNLTRLIRYSTELYSKLEAETGLATGWKQCGSLSVARTEERMVLLRRSAAMANAQGVDCEPLTPQQAGEKYPIMRTDDLVGAVWLPGDGKANPADITQALARGARTGGVRIFEKTRVTAVDTKDGRVTGVQTTEGPITAEIVVNCAGQWARQLGRMVGVTVPLYSCEHMYIVTEKMENVPRDLPVMRDPDGYIYFKEEVGGLLMGGFEPEAKPWNKDVIPDDFEFGMLPDDWDQFQILMDNALIRVPALEKTGIKTFMNGPESFTPDLNYILGEAPQLKGFFVGAGFNSMGIASSGGAGMALAEWIVAGEPTLDLWPVDIRRFAGFHGNDALAARPGLRDARPALQDGVAAARAGKRPAVPPLAALRPAEGKGRLVRQQDGLGAAQLVRRNRQDAGHAIWLGPRRLVRFGRRRAPRHARGRDGHRRDLVRQDPGAGPRRRSGIAAARGQRYRRAGRPHGLHRHPERRAAPSRATSRSPAWRATNS